MKPVGHKVHSCPNSRKKFSCAHRCDRGANASSKVKGGRPTGGVEVLLNYLILYKPSILTDEFREVFSLFNLFIVH